MNFTTKLFKFSMFLFLVMGLSMTVYGQEDPTPDEVDQGDGGPIFDTDVKGSIYRDNSDCYDLYATTNQKLHVTYSLDINPFIDLTELPCDMEVRVVSSLGSTSTQSIGPENTGTISGAHFFTDDVEQIEALVESCTEDFTISVTMDIVCLDDEGNAYVFTFAEIQEYLGITYTGLTPGGEFSFTFDITFCCPFGFKEPMIDDTNIRSKSTTAEFDVINYGDQYKVILDDSYANQDVRVDVVDLSGRILNTKQITLGAFQNEVTIEKLNSQKGINIITVRSGNEVLSKKVFN